MKILLVIEQEPIKETIIKHLSPLGFDFIHYLMDNIDEVTPDIVIFSAEDYPRHWKPFICLLKESEVTKDSLFILLSGSSFTEEEANKAAHLKVSGVIQENLHETSELNRLTDIISRKHSIYDERFFHRYSIDNLEELELVFSHPVTLKLITGKIIDISTTGISFSPDNPHHTADIPTGTEIPLCSLQIENEILTFTCVINRNNRIIAFSFPDIDSDMKKKIPDFINNKGKRTLNRRVHSEIN